MQTLSFVLTMVNFVVVLVNASDQQLFVTDITTVEMDLMNLTAVSNYVCTYVYTYVYQVKQIIINVAHLLHCPTCWLLSCTTAHLLATNCLC